ncbi:unnamed protein product [Adineta steineri]|uniref:Uncharacterized protein n=1 Tax=Adineta steineri TaxID=433720 RepID=A0A815J8D4_9BILA|nr:unnamed protein product [Adineta steineri]CAF1034049.1 unnamed protein product [Adineta steineri]CAF1375994.1 unnamed protein product [Adineta steineri]CAF1605696.1 unnamed protein product [Adineta steineri]
MANFSSTLNEDKNMIRSDPSRIYEIGQTPLARLRPEKLDDAAIKNQITLIQEICTDIDPDVIALVFHECDYNMQNTIAKIRAGDFEDGGWQKAKSNNKKKNHNIGDQISNGNIQCDSERSFSQRTSPTSSLRGGSVGVNNRQESYQHSSRTNPGRRGNDPGRNHFTSRNPRYPSRNYSNNNNKPLSTQQNPSEPISLSKEKDEIKPIISSATDEYEFNSGNTQTLTFENSIKTSSSSSNIKRSIPQEPVSMHPTVQFSTEPIDIQFGDVQWNDSVPITVTPSNSSVLAKSLDNQQSSPVATSNEYQQQLDVQNNLSSSHINQKATNETDRELLETTNRLSTSSISSSVPIANNTLANNSSVVPQEGTSHLSDHLSDSLQQQQRQQAPLQITSSSSSLTDATRLPPTSTPNASEYASPTSQNNNPFITNILQPSLSTTSNGLDGNSSAFTSYNISNTFQPITRDVSQTAPTWNHQASNYKPTSKSTMIQPGAYPQPTSYQLPPQQQFIVGTYPYHTPALYPVITTSVDPWSTTGFESYSTYPTPNYIPTYPAQQQQYHSTATTTQPNKHDQFSYDKDFFANYGQPRLSNNELSNSSQTKDAPIASKLSATAATYSQGAPLTAASPATFYINPFLYTVPTYYASHQDRSMSYPTIDNRDNRNGASYGGNNNRNHYHQQQQQQQQQQRTYNNSTWHSQQ